MYASSLASPSGSCEGGAAGQGGAALLTSLLQPPEDASPQERETYSALIQTLVAGIASAAGASGSDLPGIIAGAQAEVDNNSNALTGQVARGKPADYTLQDYLSDEELADLVEQAGGEEAVEEYWSCISKKGTSCAGKTDAETLALDKTMKRLWALAKADAPNRAFRNWLASPAGWLHQMDRWALHCTATLRTLGNVPMAAAVVLRHVANFGPLQ